MTKADDPLLGQRIAGRFLIEERLGAGGMGVVYRAHQDHVERPVAVKVLHPDRADDEAASEQFLREARAVSQLTSPHTVTLIDVGPLETGGWFLVMELLEGHTLRTKLAERQLDVAEAVKVADQIALSLGEAHTRGIVHRDLKPLNVFMARTPGHAEVVKVLDFGLAALAHGESSQPTSSGGTPRYMAPEAIAGAAADPRADVYALGLILYEMLAGKHPFEDLEGDALLEAQLGTPPPPLSEATNADIPDALRKLVDRCLAKHPRLRPSDGGKFRETMREAFGLPEEQPAEPQRSPKRDEARGHDTKATLPSTMSLSRLRAGLRRDNRSRAWWLVPAVGVLALGLWLQQRGRSEAQLTQTPPPPMPSSSPVADAAEPPPASSATALPAPRQVDILFHSIPDGATVVIEGKPRGETPVSVALDVNVPIRAKLQLRGYRDADLELTPKESSRIRHVFQRANAAPTADPVERKVDHYLD